MIIILILMHKQVASIVQCFFSCITSGSSKQNGKIYQHLARKNLQDKRGVVEKIILMRKETRTKNGKLVELKLKCKPEMELERVVGILEIVKTDLLRRKVRRDYERSK